MKVVLVLLDERERRSRSSAVDSLVGVSAYTLLGVSVTVDLARLKERDSLSLFVGDLGGTGGGGSVGCGAVGKSIKRCA